MMVHLLESSSTTAAAMWNETVFPSGNRSIDHQCHSASMELERRLVNCGKFFNGLQDKNYAGEFEFESNSRIFPARNCYEHDEVKEITAAGSLANIRDPTNKQEAATTFSSTKRLKTSYSKQQQKTTMIPGTMPLSKVPVRRSQKLGDKITALQQLVSPFGKTDTASVLHEAAFSIKLLHDQIEMLLSTTPYTGIGSSHSHHQGHGGSSSNSSSAGGLRKRGLCLVPIYTIHGLNLMKKEPTDHMPL